MDTDKNRLAETAITEKIIGCAYTVSNTLGAGFLEKVYENALAIEIREKTSYNLATSPNQRNLRWHHRGRICE